MQLQNITLVRLAHYQSVFLKPLRKYTSGASAPRIVASQAFDAAWDKTMGKDKVQFLLKTPKGTKDC